MRTSVFGSAIVITTTIVLAACGGGDSGSSNATAVSAAPAPATAPAPAGTNSSTSTGTNSATTTGAGTSTSTGSTGSAGSSSGTSSGSTSGTGTVSNGSVPTVASLPPGLQSGGTAVKTSSGYNDALLTGRWRSADSESDCLDLPAILGCTTALSLSSSLGFTASGNSATRIREIRYYSGAGCAAANLAANFRGAEDIAFQAADTNISDSTTGSAAGAQIAVRQGVVTAERFEAGDQSVLTSLFAGCPTLNPSTDPTPTQTTTCAQDTVQLRIEQSATGTPVLLAQDFTNCQPGTAVPPTTFEATWTLIQSSGEIKLP